MIADVLDLLELGQAQAAMATENTPVQPTVALTLTADDAGLVAAAISRVLATRPRPPGDTTDAIGARLAAHRTALLDAVQAAASADGSQHAPVVQRVLEPLSPTTAARLLGTTPRTVTERCGTAHRLGVPGINRIGRHWVIDPEALEALT